MGHTTLPSNRHIFQTPLFTGGPYQQMVDLICRTQTPPTILEFGQSWGDPGSRGEPHFAWYAPTVFHQNFPIRSKTRLKKPPSKEYFLCAKISQSVKVSTDSRLRAFWEAFNMKERTRKTQNPQIQMFVLKGGLIYSDLLEFKDSLTQIEKR